MKKIVALLLALVLVLSLAACASSTDSGTPSNDTAADQSSSADTTDTAAQPTEETSAPKDGLTIQIVPMSTGSEYWNALRSGAVAAADEFGTANGGITILYDGPASKWRLPGSDRHHEQRGHRGRRRHPACRDRP